jgi:hypothetical protein
MSVPQLSAKKGSNSLLRAVSLKNDDALKRALAYFGGAMAIGAVDFYQTINRSLFHIINSCKLDQCGYQGGIMGASVAITAAALFSKGASKKRLIFNIVLCALFNMDLADDVSASLQSHSVYYFVNLPQRFMNWRVREFGNTFFAGIANLNKVMVAHMQLGYFVGVVGIAIFGVIALHGRVRNRSYPTDVALQLERAKAEIERNRVLLR